MSDNPILKNNRSPNIKLFLIIVVKFILPFQTFTYLISLVLPQPVSPITITGISDLNLIHMANIFIILSDVNSYDWSTSTALSTPKTMHKSSNFSCLLFKSRLLLNFTPLASKAIKRILCGPKNDLWPRNMLIIKNLQFLANHCETLSKVRSL